MQNCSEASPASPPAAVAASTAPTAFSAPWVPTETNACRCMISGANGGGGGSSHARRRRGAGAHRGRHNTMWRVQPAHSRPGASGLVHELPVKPRPRLRSPAWPGCHRALLPQRQRKLEQLEKHEQQEQQQEASTNNSSSLTRLYLSPIRQRIRLGVLSTGFFEESGSGRAY